MNTYLRLFECCRPVKGFKRSIICDTQRGNYDYIPNILYDILINLADKSIEDIKNHFKNKHDDDIDEYFDFLIQKDYAFYCTSPESFPALDLSWESPSTITNAIIDIDVNSNHNYRDIIMQLDRLRCDAVQFRAYASLSYQDIEFILYPIKKSGIRIVELLIKYHGSLTQEILKGLCKKYPRITNVFIHGTPKPIPETININGKTDIYYTSEIIHSEKCCGVILPFYFSTSLETFTEAQKHNSCLNRKLSIDKDGFIKNCPSMLNHYGKADEVRLEEVVNNPAFQKLFHINKDQIKTCKDCEFRYICTDCRAFVEDPNDIYSKPLKCGYNPYKAVWEKKRITSFSN